MTQEMRQARPSDPVAPGTAVPGTAVPGTGEPATGPSGAVPPAARHDAVARPLGSRAEAEAYVASVCFKHGPPRLVGVELEWILYRPEAPTAVVDPDVLRAALGPFAPRSLDPSSESRPLPAGCDVTVEPGGQIEIASPPLADLGSLTRAVTADAAALHAMLAEHGLRVQPRAADPLRPARRVLDLPRYRAMECVFDRVGPHGRSGMCSTSAVQVCLDAGTADAVADRWAALHELGPVLVAAFANSPVQHGRRTGWKSSRLACWLSCDPVRTAPPRLDVPDPALAWAERVIDTPLLCVRGDGADGWDAPAAVTFADWVDGRRRDGVLDRAPTTADLDYHVSTLFPPVRPHGHLEVRYVDGQPGADWALPTAVLLALTSGPDVVSRVREVCAPVGDRWVAAARDGLADAPLARAAARLFPPAVDLLRDGTGMVACPPEVAARLQEFTERYVLRGRCPADDPAPDEAGRPAGAVTPFPPGLYGPDPAANEIEGDT